MRWLALAIGAIIAGGMLLAAVAWFGWLFISILISICSVF